METPLDAKEIAWHVLGNAAIDQRVRRWIVRELRDHHWPTAETLAVFQAIRALELEGAPVDLQTLYEKVQGKVPAATLTRVVEEPTAGAADYWLARHCVEAERRWFTELLGRWDHAMGSHDPWRDVKARILSEFRDFMASRRARSATLPAPELAEEVALEFRPPGPKPGFPRWDRMIGGFEPGTIHVIAGRPGRGKSSMTLRLAHSVARQEASTLMLPLEMGAERTAAWMDQIGALDSRIHLMREPDRRWAYLKADLEAHLEAFRPALVVLDHLGYVYWYPARRDMNRAYEIGEILRELKEVLRRHQAAAVVVCQLSRAVEGRRSARPVLSDLRESGEIEQEADVIGFLWAEPKDTNKAEVPCWLSLDKNRLGPKGESPMSFYQATQEFRERELEEAKD